MKKNLRKVLGLGLVLGMGMASISPAALDFYEDFDYTAGDLSTASSGVWAIHSGTAGVGEAQVTDAPGDDGSSLAYAGFADPSGNRLAMGQAYAADYNRPFTAPLTTGTKYASMLVKFTSAPSTTGTYFTHFFNGGTTFRARVLARQDGDNASAVNFGIDVAGTPVATTDEFAIGDTHLLVFKYDRDADTASLFLNPDPSGAEPAPLMSDTGGGGDVLGFALRQASSMGLFQVDEVRVGDTWGDVVVAGAAPLVKAVIGADSAIGNWTPASAADMTLSGGVYSVNVNLAGDGSGEWKVFRDKAAEWADVFGPGADFDTLNNNFPPNTVSGSTTFYYSDQDTTATGWEPALESAGWDAFDSFPWVAVGDFQDATAEGANWNPNSAVTAMTDQGAGLFTYTFIPSNNNLAGGDKLWKVVSNNNSGTLWDGEWKFAPNGWAVDGIGDNNTQTIPAATTDDRVTLSFNAHIGRLQAVVTPLDTNPTIASAFALDDSTVRVVLTAEPAPSAVEPADFTVIEDHAGAATANVVTTVTPVDPITYDLTLTSPFTADALEDSVTVDVSTANFFGGIMNIVDIQDGTVPVGSIVTVEAVVTGTDGNDDHSIQMSGARRANEGAGIFLKGVASLAVGDEIVVTGTVAENFSVTSLQPFDVLSQAAGTPVAPVVIAASDFTFDNAEDAAPAEDYEGVLVTIQGLSYNGALGFGEHSFLDGASEVHTDDLFYAQTYTAGHQYDVTGIGYYSFSDYKLLPRSAADIVDLGVPGAATLVSADPVSSDTLHAKFDVEPADYAVGDFTLVDFVSGAVAIQSTSLMAPPSSDTVVITLTTPIVDDFSTDTLTYVAGNGGSDLLYAGLIEDIQSIQQSMPGGPNYDSAPFDTTANVAVRGTVLHDEEFQEFWLTNVDGAGGPWSGLMVRGNSSGIFTGAGDVFDTGDDLTVVGTISDRTTGGGSQTGFQNVTVEDLFDIEAGSRRSLPAPTVVNVTDVDATSAPNGSAEQYEAVLVSLVGVSLTVESIDAFAVARMDDGLGNKVDMDDDADFGYDDGGAYGPSVGSVISDLTGIVTDLFGSYKINPRNASDVTYDFSSVTDWMLLEN